VFSHNLFSEHTGEKVERRKGRGRGRWKKEGIREEEMKKEKALESLPLKRTPVLLDWGPTLMTSFNLNCLLKGPVLVSFPLL
jgi:hypothetical protein